MAPWFCSQMYTNSATEPGLVLLVLCHYPKSFNELSYMYALINFERLMFVVFGKSFNHIMFLDVASVEG